VGFTTIGYRLCNRICLLQPSFVSAAARKDSCNSWPTARHIGAVIACFAGLYMPNYGHSPSFPVTHQHMLLLLHGVAGSVAEVCSYTCNASQHAHQCVFCWIWIYACRMSALVVMETLLHIQAVHPTTHITHKKVLRRCRCPVGVCTSPVGSFACCRCAAQSSEFMHRCQHHDALWHCTAAVADVSLTVSNVLPSATLRRISSPHHAMGITVIWLSLALPNWPFFASIVDIQSVSHGLECFAQGSIQLCCA
jgi:hypothetical protein